MKKFGASFDGNKVSKTASEQEKSVDLSEDGNLEKRASEAAERRLTENKKASDQDD